MPSHPPGPEDLAAREDPLRPSRLVSPLRLCLLWVRAGLEGLPLLLHRLSPLRLSRLVVPVGRAGLDLLAHPAGLAGQECLDRLWLPEPRLALGLPLALQGPADPESPGRPLSPAAPADLDRLWLLEGRADLDRLWDPTTVRSRTPAITPRGREQQWRVISAWLPPQVFRTLPSRSRSVNNTIRPRL